MIEPQIRSDVPVTGVKLVTAYNYLSQKNNINPYTRILDRSTQCAISTYCMEILNQKDKTRNPKFNALNHQTIEHDYYLAVDNYIKNTTAKDTRFQSDVHRSVVNSWLTFAGLTKRFQHSVVSVNKLKALIDLDISVALGTNITTFLKGASGHFQDAVGYCDQGLISNDPYGWAHNGYKDDKGKLVLYTWAEVDRLFTPFSPKFPCLMSWIE